MSPAHRDVASCETRLDKWLWHARFFRTRGAAQRVCGASRVRVNGTRVSKAHQLVRPGDVLTFAQGRAVRVIRVLAIAERRGSAQTAASLYEDLSPDTPAVPASGRDQ